MQTNTLHVWPHMRHGTRAIPHPRGGAKPSELRRPRAGEAREVGDGGVGDEGGAREAARVRA